MATGTKITDARTSRWELDVEAIIVKIRWFGLVVGVLLVNLGDGPHYRQSNLNAILLFGALFTLLDTWHSARGRVFLGKYPLVVSVMEALFISLLCYYHRGLDSPFRFYYFLSLICIAIRHASFVTYVSCGIHCLSYSALLLAVPQSERQWLTFVLTLVVILWVTWASDALALLLKRVGNHLEKLNSTLETRIAERTRELHESQAHVLHQERMAALGLLAAGVAHEVGNRVTSISAMVQILQRREHDEHTGEKLALISGQLKRIQATLRELVQFSRPPSTVRSNVSIASVVDEACDIAHFYQRTARIQVVSNVPSDLPRILGARDQLVQVVLNLILNAVDATMGNSPSTARIEITARALDDRVEVAVIDNGCGLSSEQEQRLFQPYFTTKSHGTGLGLFVSRKMIEEHGGRITHEANPNGGAIFRFSLPGSRSKPADDNT